MEDEEEQERQEEKKEQEQVDEKEEMLEHVYGDMSMTNSVYAKPNLLHCFHCLSSEHSSSKDYLCLMVE